MKPRYHLLQDDELEPFAIGVRGCARALALSPRQVWYLIKTKQLTARRWGGRTVVLVSSMRNFVKRDHPAPVAGSK